MPSLLIKAVRDNDEVTFDILIKEKLSDVNAQDGLGNTALIHAVNFDPADVFVTKLLNAKAMVDTKNKFGVTALMEAARLNREDIVSKLLAANADLNIKDNNHHTAKRYAHRWHNYSIEKLLTPNKKAKIQPARNPLQQFIEQPKATPDLDKVDFNGDFPLKVAAYTSDISSIRQLLADKASVDNADPIGVTALMMTKDDNIAYELIEAKATVDKQNNSGETALHRAALWNRGKVVSVLLDAKASVCAQDKNGQTPLMHSLFRMKDQPYNLVPLLATQDSVNMQDYSGVTALMLASTVVAVKSLLQAGASYEIKDGGGRTALDLALAMKNEDKVDSLIIAGATSKKLEELYGTDEPNNTPRSPRF